MNSLTKYILGYLLSIVLTFAAIGALYLNSSSSYELLSQTTILALLTLLALTQFLVQLMLFLHLGEERKNSPTLAVFLITLFVVGVLVGGTMWIMRHLEHNTHAKIPFQEGVVTPQTELK